MAAPLRQALSSLSLRRPLHQITLKDRCFEYALPRRTINFSPQKCARFYSKTNKSSKFPIFSSKKIRLTSLLLGGAAVGVTCVGCYVAARSFFYLRMFKVYAEQQGRPTITPSRQVLTDTDNKGLKLTLYQFQTCPFCCKVRAVLDFYGFSYDVIEVNSVTKKQIKWSDYQKVPILVVQPTESKEEVVLKDSSVIISVLESYLHDNSTSIAKFNSYFPCMEEKSGRKIKYDFPNKYFIMFQDKTDLLTSPKQRSEERKWRKWADSNLVHMLSPNVYRSASEALQAFNYFSEVGQWEEHFSWFERLTIIYVGAAVMYIMGFILKRRYELKDDVRQSLYDSCNEWLAALGKKGPFMGGHEPNLADLAVYGVLSSIEGCLAFQDLLKNTNIGPWYKRMKNAISEHHGAHPLNSKSTPSDVPKLLKNK